MFVINYSRRHSRTLMSIAESVRESAQESARVNTARILNTQHFASLYCLPAELICAICDYLPIAEILCLMISCARFWNGRNGTPAFVRVQQLVHAPRLKHPYRYDLVEARFHILRLMEFDKIYGKGIRSLCCWACMSIHGKSQFSRPKKRVNLKLSVEEQRISPSAASRHCNIKCKRIWVGICYEMSFAELRDIQLCESKTGVSIKIAAGGCFSKRVEFRLETGWLSRWFYLGRLSRWL